jgi:hypothetical protein
MNIFERASRSKLRFPSSVGGLTTEQLWDLPLTVRGDKPNLDATARAIHSELKGIDEVSFVDEKPNPRKIELDLALEVVKHVIASKLADKAAAEKAAETSARKRKLLDALASKEEQKLVSMTKEEIEAELAKIDA